MTVAVRESFCRHCERLDESGFVLLTVKSKRECFLTRLDDLVSSKDENSGDEFRWDSSFEEIDHEDLRGYELKAAGKVHFLPLIAVVGSLMNVRRVQKLRVIFLFVVVAVQHQHKVRRVDINSEKVQQDFLV